MDHGEDTDDMVFTPPPSSRSGSRNRRASQTPQETLRQFWEQFNSKFPGRIYTVLPNNPYARRKAARVPNGVIQGQNAGKSYEEARKECQRAVERIVKECERLNQKYTDPHFDIEVDLKSGRRDCLDGIDAINLEMRPRGVKRVTEIFEKPQFYVNGPTASDVRQGRDGDCWFMAALCTMGNKHGLIEEICVARNEKVGVYGFVFYRDGDWQQCIVDDKLYLRAADYDESVEERPIWDDINRADTEEEYRKVWQTGSRALYFAQCVDENETWLPLLEKAYAKAHGDFSSIEGGFVGEAIEDLTGGVTSEVMSNNILDKDRFWSEELMKFFWISYNDLLKKYQHFDRTRLFGPEWSIAQQWTTINVPWSADYHSTKFAVNVTKAGPVVLVLSQLDSRYFKGLAGEYDFILKFRVQKEGEDDYIVRSQSSWLISRSVNAEIDLEPGRYHVVMKVTAYRAANQESTEEVVTRLAREKREKLVQIGLSYDLAHAKGMVAETDDEKRAREELEQRLKAAERQKQIEATRKKLQKEWIRRQKMTARKQRIAEKLSAKNHGNTVRDRALEQILTDGPVQSPLELGNSSGDSLNARPTSNESVPIIKCNGIHVSEKEINGKGQSLRSTLDSSYSSLSSYHEDLDLLEGFEFDPDLDMAPEEPAEPRSALSTPNDCPEDTASAPWNAVCVVGLRVYSKDPQLSLEVVRSVSDGGTGTALDMDDPLKSASFSQLAS
ncbi:hypothetical protein BBP40_009900 [Aspergillus hancockii]|nr:hypothetical protein BBP40_009900 [Aspergillus hancockii]